MMAFQQGGARKNHGNCNDPLAAALTAAAALARNGGTFLYDSTGPAAVPSDSSDNRMPSSPSPVNINSNSNSSNNSVYDDDDDDDHHHQDIDEDGNDNDNDNDIENGSDNGSDDTTPMIVNEEDTKRRMARSRERNREHARRTRRRKKAQLENLQLKAQGLQAENKILKQSLEECRIASILIGFSVSDGDDRDDAIQSLLKEATEIEGKDIFRRMVGGKRTRFVSDASDTTCTGVGTVASCSASGSNSISNSTTASLPLKIEINGQTTIIGGDCRSHLNWKTGVYTNEIGVRCLLTNQQLESLRRERNRMHAKMTRDRKKSFIATIEKTIEELESSNQRMNAVLDDVIHIQKSPSPSTSDPTKLLPSKTNNVNVHDHGPLPTPDVTPSCSPANAPLEGWAVSVPELTPELPYSSITTTMTAIHNVVAPIEREQNASPLLPPKKRICHGFSLHF